MGMASSSSSGSTGFETSGDINVNQPNVFAWLVGGLALILVAFLWKRKKKRRH